MNKDILIKLGLTDGESKVYLALLKTGSSTVGPIVKEAHVAYSNIYEILDRLLDKGLISYIIKEKTKHFQAVSPSGLKEYLKIKEGKIQEEKIELERLIPELENLQNRQNRQEAEIFTGLKGIKTAYYKMLDKGSKKETWFFFYTDEGQITDDFYGDMYPVFKKIPSKGIANKAYRKSDFIKKTKFNVKYVGFPLPGTIDIYKDKVMLISWKPIPTAILIISEEISNKFKEYFNSIWEDKNY
ncbi:MAG: hypothetical protein KKC19_03935 [Nanoarchaeota archaeon]|nr:hypothetical protein [Nanoarchaeota archaeon]